MQCILFTLISNFFETQFDLKKREQTTDNDTIYHLMTLIEKICF